VCVCVYIMHLCMHVHTCACVHACACVYAAATWTHPCVRVCVHHLLHVCVGVRVRADVHVCVLHTQIESLGERLGTAENDRDDVAKQLKAAQTEVEDQR
jgi:hypothetical protein